MDELHGPERDGTSQRGRARAELAPGYVRLDERDPADLLAALQYAARRLVWYGPDGAPDGDWTPMFADLSASGGGGRLSHAEAAAFAADPAAFPGARFDPLRRPHMMLLLACVRLLRHGQKAVNAVADRHYDYQLRDLLGLRPAPARPDRAFVLFEPAAGVATAEAPAGLRLLAGRGADRHDRVFRLDQRLLVGHARVAAVATSFVDREVFGLAEARRSDTRTPAEQLGAVLALVYGAPRPGDPPPPLRGAPVTAGRWPGLARLLAFASDRLALQLSELRGLVERRRRRATDLPEWQAINAALQAGGRAARGDPRWTLKPADPRAFAANLLAAYGSDPMAANGLEEVRTVDDLFLRRDEPAVRRFIEDRLRLGVDDQFVPMMERKRAADADWRVVNGYLAAASQRRGSDAWPDAEPRDPLAFDANLAAALGTIDWSGAGPEAAGVGEIGAFLDRVEETARWFFLPAEKLRALFALVDPAGPAADWAAADPLFEAAHVRKVAADESAAMRALREASAAAGGVLDAPIAAAAGEPVPASGRLDALARWLAPADYALVRAARDPAGADPVASDVIDGILARARRARLGLPRPVPRREHWHALWADQLPADLASAPCRAFGARPADGVAAPATLGWAIASPALALSSGSRRITLLLIFADDRGGPLLHTDPDPDEDVALRRPFAVEISAGRTWLSPSELAFEQVPCTADTARGDLPGALIALRVTLTLDAAQPAAAAPVGDGLAGSWPVVRLRLRAAERSGRVTTAYQRYCTLRLVRAELRATVGGDGAPGLWPLDVETEAGAADGRKPFDPFGMTAPVGAALAIGHPDLANKRLTAVALGWQWQGAPADLAAHYANYPPRRFVATVALVEGNRTVVLGESVPLFGADPAAPVRTPDLRLDAAASAQPAEAERRPVRDRRRHLLLTLGGTGFGHAAYAGLAMEKATALATALRDPKAAPDPGSYIVRPPWTPRMQRLSLDLTAEHAVDLRRYDRRTAIDRVYQLHPFGAVEAPDASADGWPLLPAYDAEGALYLGLDRTAAPGTIQLLFQIQPSASGAEPPGGLAWSYLDTGGWVTLPEPPTDRTLGLARSGLIGFTLPAAAPDSRMPGGLYWLRATVTTGAAAAPTLLGVHAQAGSATLVDADPMSAAPRPPLPAGTIRAIADVAPGLLRVHQPYASAGGVPAEDEAAFRIRAGERLRHKGRALSAWDYERLVLARFPEVHKVKCLPATLAGGLGRVRLVVVPDVAARRVADPLTPRASAALLGEVEAYLRPLAPALARIEVGHPLFVRVRVRVGVRFRNGGDPLFDSGRLNDAINRHLAPWAYEEGAEVALGQRIDAAALVAFIDGLPFVDFVAGCRLFQSEDGVDYRPGAGTGEAAASIRPDAVLTPASLHEIDVIAGETFDEGDFTGIGYMKISLDFIVANQEKP